MPFALALPVVASAATAATAAGTTRSVPSVAYPTVRDAVLAASSGDRIEVDGSYAATDARITVSVALEILGVNGRPTLTGADPAALFEVASTGALTLENVVFDGRDAGRLLLVEGGSATLRDCELTSVASDTDGGGVLVDDGSLVIDGCDLHDGSAVDYGGLVAILGGTGSIVRSALYRGSAGDGGLVAAVTPGALTVDRSSLSEGSAGGRGGAIWASSALTVTGSSFRTNTSFLDGGAIRASAGITLHDSWLEGNSTIDKKGNGGGVEQAGGFGDYQRVFFCDDHAARMGGGLRVAAGDATGSELVFAANTAAIGGGGVRLDKVPATLPVHAFAHVTLIDNVSTSSPIALSNFDATVLADSFVKGHTNSTQPAVQASQADGLVVTSTAFEDNTLDVGSHVIADATDLYDVVSGVTASGCDLLALVPGSGSPLENAASDGRNLGGLLGAGEWPDVDGDGWLFVDDCDDDSADVHPGAVEAPGDEVDQDCDGSELCYDDDDGDGLGDPAALIVSSDADCDDRGESATPDDACLGYDDRVDGDSDGVPDGCDPCPADAPPDDLDHDDVCNADDACEGYDDHLDADHDSIPDGCDECSVGDGSDRDGDGQADACDPCPDDPAPDEDSDHDGVCNTDDVCPGSDDGADQDLDHLPDGCDGCPTEIGDDLDGDGVCDPEDPCPIDAPDDPDGDGVCTSADLCPDDPDPSCAPTGRDVDPPRPAVGCACDSRGAVGPAWLLAAVGLLGARSAGRTGLRAGRHRR
jgi:hypothetical protein